MPSSAPLRSISSLTVLVLGTFATSACADDSTGIRIGIIQCGYPGSPRSAKGFLATLTAHLEKKTSISKLSAFYHNVPKDALAEIATAPPRFGVVSLGFYLENRAALGMRARLETTPRERYFVVARRGTVDSLGGLRQQSVAGGALHEPKFLDWIVFPTAAVGDWKIEPTLRPSRALRELLRGDHGALVLNGREYRSFEAIGKLQGLVKIGESEPFPIAVVVTFDGTKKKPDGKNAGPPPKDSAQLDELVTVFRDLPGDKTGRAILTTMGCKAFREVDSTRLKKLEETFDAHNEPKK